MKLKFKCIETLEIYYLNKNKMFSEFIEKSEEIFEMPNLIGYDSKKRISDLYEEIKYTYQDKTLYENDNWINLEYEQFVNEYFGPIDFNDNSNGMSPKEYHNFAYVNCYIKYIYTIETKTYK